MTSEFETDFPCLSTDLPLVHVVTVQGEDYEHVVGEANALGGSTDAVTEVLARWDYCHETDAAALLYPQDMPTVADLQKLSHQIHSVCANTHHYCLLIDHRLGLYALYRLFRAECGVRHRGLR